MLCHSLTIPRQRVAKKPRRPTLRGFEFCERCRAPKSTRSKVHVPNVIAVDRTRARQAIAHLPKTRQLTAGQTFRQAGLPLCNRDVYMSPAGEKLTAGRPKEQIPKGAAWRDGDESVAQTCSHPGCRYCWL